ncbi:MAG: hypothetical protein LBJ41_07975 [Treponema sp.]|nr:hypothetical protein [Treponema sp.]
MNQKLPIFVRLIRFVCLWFISAFVVLTTAYFLAIRIDLARMLSFTQQEAKIDSLLTAGWRSLPLSVYITMLFGLSYCAQYKFPIFLSIIHMVVLSLLWIGFFSLILSVIQRGSPWPTETSHHLGGVGLITVDGDQSQVLLQVPDLSGMQVIAPPNSPLMYEDTQVGLGVPSVFFRNDTMYFIMERILGNFTHAGEQCGVRLRESFLSFFLYILALVFCLSTLRFVFDASSWPLANLFLGALLFWGVLKLETLLDSEQARTFISAINGEAFPMFLVVPLALFILGLVFLLLSFGNSSLKKRWAANEDY